MSKQEIFLKDQAAIVNFVSKLEQYPFQADLHCGSHVVDAKSLLGVLGFGMGKVLTLSVYSDEDVRSLPGIAEYVVTR